MTPPIRERVDDVQPAAVGPTGVERADPHVAMTVVAHFDANRFVVTPDRQT
jgi:hypothetical protein